MYAQCAVSERQQLIFVKFPCVGSSEQEEILCVELQDMNSHVKDITGIPVNLGTKFSWFVHYTELRPQDTGTFGSLRKQ